MQNNNNSNRKKPQFPIGIDKSILNEDEINRLLKMTRYN
jgi:hypothetical protein